MAPRYRRGVSKVMKEVRQEVRPCCPPLRRAHLTHHASCGDHDSICADADMTQTSRIDIRFEQLEAGENVVMTVKTESLGMAISFFQFLFASQSQNVLPPQP